MSDRSTAPQRQPRKAALAAYVGSGLEFYDFLIYGTAAALAFNDIFFPDSDPTAGTLLALATFGVGYVVRPLGAFILGHVGDRFGRKRLLLITLFTMGLATVLIGCLPTYGQIGVAAPVMLVVLRIVQGLSAAAEQSGANSMALEHAPDGKRAYYSSFTLMGSQTGQVIATAVFLPIAALPEDQLLSWGWRIPFWLGGVILVSGYIIRRRVAETPSFETEVASAEKQAKTPLTELFRSYWPQVVRVALAHMICVVTTVASVWALSFAVNEVGLSRSTMLWVAVVANITSLATISLWAKLADRIGRRPVFLIAVAGDIVMTFAYLGSIAAENYFLVFASGIGLFAFTHGAFCGASAAFYGEMFPTRVRLSGSAIGTQFGLLVAGFAPAIAAALAGAGSNWVPVALFVTVVTVISGIAVATGPDYFRTPTDRLGEPKAAGRGAAEPVLKT